MRFINGWQPHPQEKQNLHQNLDLDRDRAIAWLKDNVSRSRLNHILGVETFAGELATRHNLDVQRAKTAGLLHDLAKFFPPKKLLAWSEEAGIEVDDICARTPHLLHADVGAVVAQREFGIDDPEILAAIALHTLGKAGMSELSCVVFIADALEPGRGDDKKLRKLRELSCQDLHKTVWRLCDYTLKQLVKQNKTIHPRIIETRNWALKIAA